MGSKYCCVTGRLQSSRGNIEGQNWKWKATMVITDTAGFEFDEDASLTEKVFALVFGWNVGIPTKIERASWAIEGSGTCKDGYCSIFVAFRT